MTTDPLVSVIVPMQDEEPSIGACLEAILAQSCNPGSFEVIVVDGGSTDRSREIVESSFRAAPTVECKLLLDPAGNTPSHLNVGLAQARGQIVVRVDARSFIPPGYLERVVHVLQDPDVVAVGGAQVPRAAPDSGLVPKAIARALRNPYLTGFSRYRRRKSSGPSDTVYLGAYRRNDLDRLGGWAEQYSTNQDYELNQRLQEEGVVWFEHTLEVEYRPRTTLSQLVAQYRRFGRWKAATWLERGGISNRHQMVLLAGGVGALALLSSFRRRPWGTSGGAVLILLSAEALVDEPGPLSLRTMSGLANVVSIGAWSAGIIEQSARFASGERLLSRRDDLAG